MTTLLYIIAALAVAHIIADYYRVWQASYLLKPATTMSIIFLAQYLTWPAFDTFTALVIFALVFSLLGDIFLMLRSDRFLAGLISFFIAHVLYISAFLYAAPLTIHLGLLIGLVLVGSGYLYVVLPKAGQLQVPVVAYGLVLQLMVLSAGSFAMAGGHSSSQYLCLIGALYFIFSDSVLGFSRFVKAWPISHSIVLASYYLAQTLLVLGLLSPR